MTDLKNYCGAVVEKLNAPRKPLHIWGGYLLAIAAIMALAMCASLPEPAHVSAYRELPSADETILRLEMRDRAMTQAVEREWKREGRK